MSSSQPSNIHAKPLAVLPRTFIVLFVIAAVILLLGAFSTDAIAQEPDCLMCHPEKGEGKSVHAAVAMGCTICHSGVDPSNIPHKFSSGFARGLMMEPPDLCYMCHDQGMFKNETIHPPVAAGMCTGCHNPHSSANETLLLAEPPDLCYNCHQKENFYGPTIHAPVGIGACTSCHNPHSSANKRLLMALPQELCFFCHDQSEFSLKTTHKPVKDGACTACHRPHAGQNQFLLIRKGNFLCRRCHAQVERMPHAIAGFSRSGHPLRARRDPVRKGKTFECLSCHVPHSSDSIRLFRYKADTTFDICVYCHKM